MQKLKQTRFILKSVAALIIGLLSFAGAAQTARAQAQEAVGNIAFERLDLDFILKGIKISEDHSASNGGCDALLALLPNAHVPWGMRTVDGTCNNLIPGGETFGAADIEFMEAVAPSFIGAQVLTQPLSPNDVIGAETSYVRGDGRTVQDSTPRLISNLIVNQINNLTSNLINNLINKLRGSLKSKFRVKLNSNLNNNLSSNLSNNLPSSLRSNLKSNLKANNTSNLNSTCKKNRKFQFKRLSSRKKY